MSTSVNLAFVEAFSANVTHLAQQRFARLMNTVMTRPLVGNTANFDRLAASAMAAKAGRHVATPILNVAHSRRQVNPLTFSWGEAIDNDDELRILIDPVSSYAQNAAAALARRHDLSIVEGITAANSLDGAGANVAFAGETIVHGGVGLTVEKLRTTKQHLDEAEAGTDEADERFFCATAEQFNNLLGTTEVSSSDFNTVKALVQGEIDTFLGFKFVRSEQLPKAATTRTCAAWTRNSCGLALNQEVFAQIARDPGLSYAWRPYYETTLGATRIDDSGVVWVECTETA